MSTGIQNYPNIEAADSDYPDGNIKDKDISLPGTPVNKLVYADMHQTLAKLLRLADITPNGLPDNEYNSFQYIEALKYMYGNFRKIQFLDTTNAGIAADGDYSPITVVKPSCGPLCFVGLLAPSGYVARCTIANFSQNSVDITTTGATIGGVASPFVLSQSESIDLTYDSGTNDWVINYYNILGI